MRFSKRTVAILLVVAVILGISSCKKAELSRQAFISEVEAYGIEQTDNLGAVTNLISRRGGKSAYYVAADKDDAFKVSNHVIDQFDTFPDLKTTDFVIAAVTEKGSDGKSYPSLVCYMIFDNGEDAKEAYNNLVDAYGDKEGFKKGTKSGVSYCIDSSVSAANTNTIGTGIYHQGDTVIYLRAMAAVKDKYTFINKICGKLGLQAP